MKFKAFLILTICIFLNIKTLLAERTTPNGTIVEVITKLKKTGSYSAVLDFIHWPTAFKRMSSDEKAKLNINTPTELFTYLKNAVADPKRIFMDQIKSHQKTLNADQKENFEKMLNAHLDKIDAEQKSLAKKIANTKFSIVKNEITDDKAIVYLKAVTNNQSETKPINLIKNNGNWYLTTTSFAK